MDIKYTVHRYMSFLTRNNYLRLYLQNKQHIFCNLFFYSFIVIDNIDIIREESLKNVS